MAAISEPSWTIITGASSGIGAELARAFAARGHSLILVARRRDRMEALATEIGASGGKGAAVEVMPYDLEDPAAPAALMDAIQARGLTIRTLVNNAGFGLRGTFAALPYDQQVAMVEVNVAAVTKLCRLVLPGLIARRKGGILNVASTAAFQAGPKMALYYATKAFVLSLSEALHEEAKPHGVTVTALCPGPVPTEFQARADMHLGRVLKFGEMSAAEVARIGLEGYEAGQAIVIPGWANRIGAWGTRLVPRLVTRRAAGKLQA